MATLVKISANAASPVGEPVRNQFGKIVGQVTACEPDGKGGFIVTASIDNAEAAAAMTGSKRMSILGQDLGAVIS